jgi:hypothetical protein
MISQKRVNTNQKKGEQTMYNTNYGNITQQELQELGYTPVPKKEEDIIYTLEETQQIIRENPYTIRFRTEEPTDLDNIMDILESTDNTRKFTITTWLNTEDYPCPAVDYYITERR